MENQISLDINMFIPCLLCSLTDAEKQVQREQGTFMPRDKCENS